MSQRTDSSSRGRLPRLSRQRLVLLGKIFAGLLVALIVVAVVPPLRKAAALGGSKAILFVASPLAPNIDDFEALPQTTKVVASDGAVLAELDEAQRRVPVELDQLPDHVKNAVLAAEDENFYEHSGINPEAVTRAFVRTATGKTQGGSTITQQLAKINYTAGERTVFRKLKEVLYASKLEKKYSKDRLLQRYLNQVYFGEQAYGIEAAAQTYFGKPAKELTVAQAALLAGKIRSPSVLDPRKRLEEVETRRNQVLDNMLEEGWLTAEEHEAASSEATELAPFRTEVDQVKAPHFVEYVKREAATLDALGGSPESRSNRLFTGGYTIETTLDTKTFDATVASVQAKLGVADNPDTPEDESDPVAAVATVVPGDGAIRNLFGGLDFTKTQFDMSSLGGRQAGSSVKPFVYLAALREGVDPRSTFDGTSGRVIPCYRKDPVKNYAGEDAGGRINVDEAMVKSVNVVFVELGCKVGPNEVAKAANDAGVPEDATKSKGGYFLGGFDANGVNALEMAGSYATFAAKGVYAKPYSIARIKDSRGRTIYEAEKETKEVFKAEEVGVLNNPLQAVVDRGTGTAAKIGRPVAGKTGTAQENRDAWFIGYTPQLSTGVWVGYPDASKPMSRVHGRAVTGGSFPAQIFSDVMKKAHEGMPVERIFTASPDQLDLKKATPDTTAPPASTETTTTLDPNATSTTTTEAPQQSTTTTARQATTTTTAPPETTTTQRRQQTTTTTTTAPPQTTTTVASSGSGGTSSGTGTATSTTTTQPG
ncbi:MAG TPA: transglycosylase domain-containing protein [Acidimicrobiales bacterium]|jgi:penicillin-binding protein 1A|nr:transglycosylase domain-containing protein [Acidimicrobiales bacterium]